MALSLMLLVAWSSRHHAGLTAAVERALGQVTWEVLALAAQAVLIVLLANTISREFRRRASRHRS